MKWNEFWKIFVSTNDKKSSIKIVHLAYEAWVNVPKDNLKNSKNFLKIA